MSGHTEEDEPAGEVEEDDDDARAMLAIGGAGGQALPEECGADKFEKSGNT